MLGKRSPQRELFRPDHTLIDFVGANSLFAFLAREGPSLFRDTDFASLYGEGGRPSVPPSQLCILLLLQAKAGVSDEEAIHRTAYDLRWKVALGLEIEEKLCAKSTLQLFRAKLVLNDRVQQIFDASVAACRKRGLGQSKSLEVAIDSTPILGRGAVRDTFNLVSDAIRLVVRAACDLKDWELDAVVASSGLTRHFGTSFKGESDLDWTNAEERRALVAQLVADARVAQNLAKKALRGYARDSAETAALREKKALLDDLLIQDIEDSPDDGEGPRIRKGTARDRIVSTTDPEMRHGHKSHSKGFEGYKGSIVVDTDDGVILATGVHAANVPDRVGAVDLVREAGRTTGERVQAVLADTAYGDLGTRDAFAADGVDVVAKAPPISARKNTFKRSAFKIDDERGVATCPAGNTSIRRRALEDQGGGFTYTFSRNDCTPCALRARCTKAKRAARTVSSTANSKRLDRLRAEQSRQRFRHRYRRRMKVEHGFGRLRALGIRQARYFGSAKTAMQLAIAASIANLGLAALRRYFGCLTAGLQALFDLPGPAASRPTLIAGTAPAMAPSRPGL